MMASATVNGAIALDFSEAKGNNVIDRTAEDSPGSGGAYEDSTLNESPYQEYSGEEEDAAVHDRRDAASEKQVGGGGGDLGEPRAKKRRKQSNPVRIAAVTTRVLEPEAGDGPDEGPLDLAADLPEESASPCDLNSLYRCSHCNALFEVEDHLRIHIEEEHVQKLLERQLQQHQSANKVSASQSKDSGNAVMGANCTNNNCSKESEPVMPSPTIPQESKEGVSKCGQNPPAPQLTPTLTQEGKDMTPTSMMPPLAAFGPPPFLIPLLSQGPTPSQPVTSTSGPPIRIFNPEAYCEICNKEFCNKYFLKTHKANKHGIYSMDTVSGSPYAGAFITANMGALTMRPLLPNPPPPNPSSNEVSPIRSSGPLNVEAYCEICQKEFCNKYFLRKHKQKIHGIFDPNSTPTSNASQGMNGTNISPAPPLDSPKSNGSSSSISSCMTANTSEILCEICGKEMSSRSMLQGHKYTVHGIVPAGSGLTSPSFNTSISSQNEEEKAQGNAVSTQASTDSKYNSVFTPERLREIGVINADAFCELCCKEFCNKYFLRTHKINKHGLSIPEFSPKHPGQSSSSVCSENNSTTYFDSSKLMNSLQAISGDLNGLCDQMNCNDTETLGDLTCEVCGRPFSSMYLLKMHKFYSHNIPPSDKEPEKGSTSKTPETTTIKEEPKSETVDNNGVRGNDNTEAPGEDLRKLQSMIQELNAPVKENLVACHICHREMENKYFLRAHMMNEHGILHSEETTTPASGGNDFIPSNKISNMSKDQNFMVRLPPLSPLIDPESYCEICKKDFCSKYFLRTHKTNVHGIPMDLSMSQNPSEPSATVIQPPRTVAEVPPPPPLPPTNAERPSVITGRNYCEICNKELCNKYFMKTHMLKMHGINVEDRAGITGAATIGGVTCDICQKELCSKYFLKVHKQNTHGIFEEPSPGKDSTSAPSGSDKEQGLPGEITDDNSRYFNHYTEICPICDRRFKSIKWLKTHMANDHNGDHLKENGISNCSEARDLTTKNCMLCGKSFSDAVTLQVHMITNHYNNQTEQTFPEPTGSKHPPANQSNTTDEGEFPETHDVGSSSNQNVGSPVPGQVHHKPRGGNGTRIYHCSYCAYATRWLSNLYAHEKRHTGLATEGEKRFVCRLCHRAYRYNHSLQRHMFSHRGAMPRILSAPLSSSTITTSAAQHHLNDGLSSLQRPQGLKKYRCSKCQMKFRSRDLCLAHIYEVHNPRHRILLASVCQKGLKVYKCRKCNFTTRHLNLLKQHIKQQHSKEEFPPIKSKLDASTEPSVNNKISPQDVITPISIANAITSTTASVMSTTTKEGNSSSGATPQLGNQLPMTYAMPQNPPSAGSFIMQPFLMAQPAGDSESKGNGTFVPSLVYLPVCQKVSEPVTIAFTLTPA